MGRNKLIAVAVVVGVGAVLAGCPSVVQITPAKPIDKGSHRTSVSIGAAGLPLARLGIDLDDDERDQLDTLPELLLEYRYGAASWFDFGLRLSSLGHALVDFKFNLVDTKRFALSLDPAVGGFFFAFKPLKLQAAFVQLSAPLLIDIGICDWLRVTIGPRYSPIIYAGEIEGYASGAVVVHTAGGTVGVEFNIKDTVWITPYGGVLYLLNGPDFGPPVLATGGVALTFRGLFGKKP